MLEIAEEKWRGTRGLINAEDRDIEVALPGGGNVHKVWQLREFCSAYFAAYHPADIDTGMRSFMSEFRWHSEQSQAISSLSDPQWIEACLAGTYPGQWRCEFDQYYWVVRRGDVEAALVLVPLDGFSEVRTGSLLAHCRDEQVLIDLVNRVGVDTLGAGGRGVRVVAGQPGHFSVMVHAMRRCPRPPDQTHDRLVETVEDVLRVATAVRWAASRSLTVDPGAPGSEFFAMMTSQHM